ncbi:hypothetical protein TNIN_176251 [Trichonephila inaurata madagascariensis]|uniref:Uncharacterized protein n=1 Tax=Trichonephila inaurata madagascariensis TaxID=2747483 RepID=A0A8X7CLF4_9ARAC|nr:hypothetical protein TNIN_176251 [Trichonephila inaurata madagascariensis]
MGGLHTALLLPHGVCGTRPVWRPSSQRTCIPLDILDDDDVRSGTSCFPRSPGGRFGRGHRVLHKRRFPREGITIAVLKGFTSSRYNMLLEDGMLTIRLNVYYNGNVTGDHYITSTEKV